jgi:hypothetical protein
MDWPLCLIQTISQCVPAVEMNDSECSLSFRQTAWTKDKSDGLSSRIKGIVPLFLMGLSGAAQTTPA